MAAKFEWRRKRAEENLNKFDAKIEEAIIRFKKWRENCEKVLNGKRPKTKYCRKSKRLFYA